MLYSTSILAALVGAALAHPPESPYGPAVGPLCPTVPKKYPPLPGPINPSPLDHSIEAALAALGRTRESFREPGTVPFPQLKPGTDTMPDIKHVVYLMMENHSYDNMMGALNRTDADGFEYGEDGIPIGTQPGVNGTVQHWFETPTPCQGEDGVTQEWTAAHNLFSNGSMSGCVVSPTTHNVTGASGQFAMSYFTPRVMPFWFKLMEQIPIADRWFCSLLGQTWPTRQYSLAATSRGITATSQNETGVTWPNGTIFDKLDKYGISWKVAWNDTENTTGNTLQIFTSAISNETIKTHVFPYQTFYDIAQNGTLPGFYYLDQRGSATTQEPAKNMAQGEALIYDVVKAIMTGPQWNETIFIINYDEHGGFCDHVPPPPAIPPDDVEPIVKPGEFQYEGFRRLGARVPAAIISPYAMTYRDANANSLEDMIDFEAMRYRAPTFPSWECLNLPLPLLYEPGNDALDCKNVTSKTPAPADSIAKSNLKRVMA